MRSERDGSVNGRSGKWEGWISKREDWEVKGMDRLTGGLESGRDGSVNGRIEKWEGWIGNWEDWKWEEWIC